MRVIYLSDHPGEKLQAARRARLAAEEQGAARYQEAVGQYQARVAEARQARAEARAQRRWWTWLRLCLSVLFPGAGAPRRPGPSRGPSDHEAILAAGVAGELYVEDQLAPAFGDDWVLFRGYKNRRGEVNSVLLGPGGLFAMEVKNRNATVHIDGDSGGAISTTVTSTWLSRDCVLRTGAGVPRAGKSTSRPMSSKGS